MESLNTWGAGGVFSFVFFLLLSFFPFPCGMSYDSGGTNGFPDFLVRYGRLGMGGPTCQVKYGFLTNFTLSY